MKVVLNIILIALGFQSYCQGSTTVYFDFNQYELTHGARTGLDGFLNNKHINWKEQLIELHGHCDSIGSDAYNILLSEKRVSEVKEYLISKGITPSQFIIVKGHGERQHVNYNRSKDERLLNRRVEIRLIKPAESALKEKEEPEPVTTRVDSTPVKPEIKSLKKQIEDSTTVAGTNIVLKNINFVGGHDLFLPASNFALEELADAMNANPGLEIKIEGHICCIPGTGDGRDLGTGKTNLSEARAKAVRDWLISAGIKRKRISYEGFGHSRPVYAFPEASEAERVANRRVEIRIIRK